MLNELWQEKFQMYAKQKLNDSQYKLYKIKINALKYIAVENKGEQSDRLHDLKDQVTDAYAKQKISEAHHEMLVVFVVQMINIFHRTSDNV